MTMWEKCKTRNMSFCGEEGKKSASWAKHKRVNSRENLETAKAERNLPRKKRLGAASTEETAGILIGGVFSKNDNWGTRKRESKSCLRVPGGYLAPLPPKKSKTQQNMGNKKSSTKQPGLQKQMVPGKTFKA